jgi:hypothetical protein
MSISALAKKPFFELFGKTECMGLFLRAAFYDAGTYCKLTRAR